MGRQWVNLASKHLLTWPELGPPRAGGPGKATRTEETPRGAGGEPTPGPEHALHEGLPLRPLGPVQQLSGRSSLWAEHETWTTTSCFSRPDEHQQLKIAW